MTEASKSSSERHLIERKSLSVNFRPDFYIRISLIKAFSYNYYSLSYNRKFFNGALNSHPQQEKKFKTTPDNCFHSKRFGQRIDCPLNFSEYTSRMGPVGQILQFVVYLAFSFFIFVFTLIMANAPVTDIRIRIFLENIYTGKLKIKKREIPLAML